MLNSTSAFDLTIINLLKLMRTDRGATFHSLRVRANNTSPAVLLPAEQALCRYWSLSRLRDGTPKPTKINSPRTGYFFHRCSPEICFDFLMLQTSENCLTCHFLSKNKKSFTSLIGYIFPKSFDNLTDRRLLKIPLFPFRFTISMCC